MCLTDRQISRQQYGEIYNEPKSSTIEFNSDCAGTTGEMDSYWITKEQTNQFLIDIKNLIDTNKRETSCCKFWIEKRINFEEECCFVFQTYRKVNTYELHFKKIENLKRVVKYLLTDEEYKYIMGIKKLD